MRRLSEEEIKIKSPKKDIVAAWTGHLEMGIAHPTSVHSLILLKEFQGFNPVVFCWGEMIGNKIQNYEIFKGQYNFWVPGQSSQKMAIDTLQKIATASSKAPESYFHKLFPMRKNLEKEQIEALDNFWDNAVEACWKSVRKKYKPHM